MSNIIDYKLETMIEYPNKKGYRDLLNKIIEKNIKLWLTDDNVNHVNLYIKSKIKETKKLLSKFDNNISLHREMEKDNLYYADIYESETFEDLFDRIQIIKKYVEGRHYARKFLKSYSKLLTDKSIKIFELIKDKEIDDEEIHTNIKKVALCKTPEDLTQMMERVLAKFNQTIESIVELINDKGMSDSVDVVKLDETKTAFIVYDYAASNLIGSSLWCISYDEEMYNSYLTKNGDYDDERYANAYNDSENEVKGVHVFVRDESLAESNSESYIAFTVSANGKITASYNKFDNEIEKEYIDSLINKEKFKEIKKKVYSKTQEKLKDEMIERIKMESKVSNCIRALSYINNNSLNKYEILNEANIYEKPEGYFFEIEDENINNFEKVKYLLKILDKELNGNFEIGGEFYEDNNQSEFDDDFESEYFDYEDDSYSKLYDKNDFIKEIHKISELLTQEEAEKVYMQYREIVLKLNGLEVDYSTFNKKIIFINEIVNEGIKEDNLKVLSHVIQYKALDSIKNIKLFKEILKNSNDSEKFFNFEKLYVEKSFNYDKYKVKEINEDVFKEIINIIDESSEFHLRLFKDLYSIEFIKDIMMDDRFEKYATEKTIEKISEAYNYYPIETFAMSKVKDGDNYDRILFLKKLYDFDIIDCVDFNKKINSISGIRFGDQNTAEKIYGKNYKESMLEKEERQTKKRKPKTG